MVFGPFPIPKGRWMPWLSRNGGVCKDDAKRGGDAGVAGCVG